MTEDDPLLMVSKLQVTDILIGFNYPLWLVYFGNVNLYSWQTYTVNVNLEEVKTKNVLHLTDKID